LLCCEIYHGNAGRSLAKYNTMNPAAGAPDIPDETVFDFFRRKGVAMRYRKGELILHAEDVADDIFYIESGFVKVFSENNRGEEYILVVYGPGELFPLLWLPRRARRKVFYEALAPSVVLRTYSDDLEAALRASPSLSFEMIERSLEQHGVFIDRINNLQYKFARERLVCCLLYLARRFGVRAGNGYEIGLRISHQVLASNINLSRESVGRELERLVRKGMVTMHGGRIVLKDMAGLLAELPGPSVNADWWQDERRVRRSLSALDSGPDDGAAGDPGQAAHGDQDLLGNQI
jgi:CRP/FNR family cyclic AMP-dependent transcriptional regulator